MNTQIALASAIYLHCTSREAKTQRREILSFLQQCPDHFQSTPSPVEYMDCIHDEKEAATLARFSDLLRDLENGQFSCVLLYSLASLGGGWQGEWNLARMTDHLHIRVISIKDHFDSTKEGKITRHTPSHSILLHPEVFPLNPAVEEIYRNPLLREDTGKNANNSAFSAFGYLFDPEEPCLMKPDPETAPVVRAIYQMYLSGFEINKIARILTKESIPNPITRRKKMGTAFQHGNNIWHSVSVLKILTNPTYIGEHIYRLPKLPEHFKQQARQESPIPSGTVIKHHHPALISIADYEAAQILLRCQPKRGIKAPSGRKFDTPFCNVVYCGVCGQPMRHRHRNNQYPNSRSVYVCSSSVQHTPDACPRIPHATEDLIFTAKTAIAKERKAAAQMREIIKDGTESLSYKKANEQLHQRIVSLLDSAKHLPEVPNNAPDGFSPDSIPESLAALVKEKDDLLAAFTAQNKWLQAFDLPEDFSLDRATAKRTIQRINVFPDGRTEIILKNQKEKKRLFQYL